MPKKGKYLLEVEVAGLRKPVVQEENNFRPRHELPRSKIDSAEITARYGAPLTVVPEAIKQKMREEVNILQGEDERSRQEKYLQRGFRIQGQVLQGRFVFETLNQIQICR